MNREAQEAYANRAGCSIHHLVNNVYRRAGPRKLPRPELLIGLVKASDGKVSLDEAIDYFLVAPVRKLAAELEQSLPEGSSVEGGVEEKSVDRETRAGL